MRVPFARLRSIPALIRLWMIERSNSAPTPGPAGGDRPIITPQGDMDHELRAEPETGEGAQQEAKEADPQG
jgi:hypothetical protein